MRFHRRTSTIAVAAVVSLMLLACVMQGPGSVARHRWWLGHGPVLPHRTFPADCGLCHSGENWGLRSDFTYDHEAETGVPLVGAHDRAQCLRCHNDRGPVLVFEAKGCIGCHEDIHQGELGADCLDCHGQDTWLPDAQHVAHYHSRFPLTGVHAQTSCRRCHPGSEVGNFVPTDTECLTCHVDDLARTTNHIGLGRGDRCHRCHMPTDWRQAEIN